MPTVLLFKSVSQYQSLNTMADELARAYREIGYRTHAIDLRREGYRAIEAALGLPDLHAILTISGYGVVDPHSEDRLYQLYRRADLPMVSLYFDPLFYYLDFLDLPVPRRIVTTTSDADLDYWRELPEAGLPGSVDLRPLPHAATPRAVGDWPVGDWRERSIPLLFTATGTDHPDAIRLQWQDLNPVLCRRLNRILEVCLASSRPRRRGDGAERTAPVLTAAIREAVGDEIDVSDPQAVRPYFIGLDLYLRARRRWQLVSALARLPLLVIGDDWGPLARRLEAVEGNRLKVRFEAGQTIDQVQSLLGRTRLFLNSCTPHHGSHERVFHAMAAGAAAVTTTSRWFAQEAPADVLLQLDPDRDDPAALVEALLADPDRAEAQARAGTRWLCARHTWGHRVATLEGWIAGLRAGDHTGSS